MKGTISSVDVFHDVDGTYLFTIDHNNTLTSLVIKSCLKFPNDDDNDEEASNGCEDKDEPNKMYKSLQIENFRLGKRYALQLEKTPSFIEAYGDCLVVTYKEDI